MKLKKVSKEKLVMSVTIGVACVALMAVMFMQFKVVEQTDITAIETMRESELKLELKSWTEKYNEINERYQDVVAKIEEYRNERVSDEKTAQLLHTELKQLNEALGKTDVEGEGIVIQVIDKEENLLEVSTVRRITAEDLVFVINELFGAGAEAISINGYRIITTSSIVDIGTEFIKVNGERIQSPYVINAIGNPDYLKSAVSVKDGQLDVLKGFGHDINVNESKRIRIEKYNGEINSRYID